MIETQPDSFLRGMVEGTKIWKMAFVHEFLEDTGALSHVSGLVDFGCANGEVTRNLWAHMAFYNYNLQAIGFDTNAETIASITNHNPKIKFTSNIDTVHRHIDQCRSQGQIVLTLSSVVHEFGSYLSVKAQNEVWDTIWSISPDYIAIRDFFVCEHHDAQSNPEDVRNIRRGVAREKWVFTVGPHTGRSILEVWEEKWGSIDSIRSMLHFLAMYRYLPKPEGDFELHEDHFSVSQATLAARIPRAYSPVFCRYYTEPIQRAAILQHFGVETAGQPLNYKLILHKKPDGNMTSTTDEYWDYKDFRAAIMQNNTSVSYFEIN